MAASDEQNPRDRPTAVTGPIQPADDGESVPLFLRLQRGAASGADPIADPAAPALTPEQRASQDRRESDRRIAAAARSAEAEERRVGDLMEQRLGDRRTNIWADFRPEGTLPGWLDAFSTPPTEAKLIAGLQTLHALLSVDQRKQVLGAIFANDIGTYRLAMFELSRVPTWQAAVEYIDYRIYQRFNIDPYGDDAKRFTQMVLDRYR